MTNSPKSIGLCMIVRDEAAIIERCLDSVRPLVDHVVIHDTGSTDNTVGIIRSWSLRRSMHCVVERKTWVDFAHNRTQALARMRRYKTTDYVLMMDADDVLEMAPGFDIAAFKASLAADFYNVPIRLGEISYHRPQIVRNALPFKYRGVVHEFLEAPPGATSGDATGLTIVAGTSGARSRDAGKYERDAEAILKALETEKDPFLISRYQFYLAQSYRDAGLPNLALPWYLMRADGGFWVEERYVALLNAGRLTSLLDPLLVDDALALFERATALVPTRAEALHGAARACRLADRWSDGCRYAERGLAIPKPGSGLFIEGWVYDYGLLDEFAVCAHYAGRHQEAAEANQRLLRERLIPEAEHTRVLANLNFALKSRNFGRVVGIETAPQFIMNAWATVTAKNCSPIWQVCAVDLPNYPHAAAFAELVEAVWFGLIHLGFRVELVRDVRKLSDRSIIIGGHLLTPDECAAVPNRAIVYNSERHGGDMMTEHYKALLARCEVWDYTRGNLPDARYVPMGYVPSFTRVRHAENKDIDVLFYGSSSPRRDAVLDDLRGRGLAVHHAFGVYGRERDELIGRAKVVLNMHYADDAPFEIVRVGYLLANRCNVVSEMPVYDDLQRAAAWALYNSLASVCEGVIRRPELDWAARGYRAFTARNEAVILRDALTATGRM